MSFDFGFYHNVSEVAGLAVTCDETKMTEAGAEREKPPKSVCVYDCRSENSAASARTIDIANMDHSSFLQALRQVTLPPLTRVTEHLCAEPW